MNSLPKDAQEALEAMNEEENQEESQQTTEAAPSTETAGEDQTTASVDDAAPSTEESEGQEATTEEDPTDEPQEWWDETELAFGQSYGLSDEEIRSFGNKDEFRRAMQVFDRHVLGKRQTQPVQQQQPAPQPEQPAQEQQTERIKLDPDEHDESLIKAFNDLQDRLEASEKRFAEQEQARMQAVHEERVQKFEAYVDGLGREDLFGKPGNRSNLNAQKLHELWDHAQTIELDNLAVGRGGTWEAFIERAVIATVPPKEQRQRSAQQDQKILQQSQQRMGGGQSTAEAPTAWDGEAKDNPSLHDAYQRMIQENGSKY